MVAAHDAVLASVCQRANMTSTMDIQLARSLAPDLHEVGLSRANRHRATATEDDLTRTDLHATILRDVHVPQTKLEQAQVCVNDPRRYAVEEFGWSVSSWEGLISD
jgi:hypothetical protein